MTIVIDNTSGALAQSGSALKVNEDSGLTITNTAGTNSVNISATAATTLTVGGSAIISGVSTDTITSKTASTDLSLSATGSNVTIASGKSLKITGASSGAVPYFNANAQLVTSVTGSSSQVLIGGTTPGFGSVTSSMVNSSIIVAAGTNAFSGNQSFGNNEATSFRVENVSSNPIAGNAGRLIWNTTASALEVDNGTSFSPVGTDSFIGTITSNSNTVTNTTTGTVFNQNVTIPANAITAGSVIKIFAAGTISSWTTGTLVFTLNPFPGLGLGFNLGSSVSNGAWVIEASIACWTSGAGGTGSTSIKYSIQNATTPSDMLIESEIISTSINTTTTNTVTVTAQWSAASTNNSVTMYNLDVLLFK